MLIALVPAPPAPLEPAPSTLRRHHVVVGVLTTVTTRIVRSQAAERSLSHSDL